MRAKPNLTQSNRCPPCPPSATPVERLIYWLGIGLGSGLPKKAPGTWGTVGGMVIAMALLPYFWVLLALAIVACVVGSFICGKTSALMGVHDDPHIVFDEWAGIWIALLPLAWLNREPIAGGSIALLALVYFVVFRVFDIIKPFPISYADKKVSGGLGIMLDDILAGIATALVTPWLLSALPAIVAMMT